MKKALISLVAALALAAGNVAYAKHPHEGGQPKGPPQKGGNGKYIVVKPSHHHRHHHQHRVGGGIVYGCPVIKIGKFWFYDCWD